MKRAIEEGTGSAAKERINVTQRLGANIIDAQLSGVPDAQLNEMSRADVQQQIETNLRESGFTEEAAREVAESRAGTEALSEQTGVTPEEMKTMTYGQINEQRKSHEELRRNEGQIRMANQRGVALRAAPRQMRKIEDSVVRESRSARVATLVRFDAKIRAGNATKIEEYQADYLAKYGTMNTQQAQEVHKVLSDSGYTKKQRTEMEAKWFETGQAAYVQARMDGKNDEQARKFSEEAQKEYLKGIHAEIPEEHREAFTAAATLSLRQMEIGAKAVEQAAETGEMNVVYAAQDAVTEQQQREVIMKYSLMSAFAVGAMFGAPTLFGETGGEAEMGVEAAAQAQMMRDIEDLAKEDQERANEAQAMIADLMEQAEESSEETTVGELEDDELKKRLEEMGVEQDKTIKEALEFTKKNMETVSVQQGRVQELKQNAVEGLEPSFHTDPREVLEMNGIMKDGQLSEFGQSVMPDILRASGGSFNNALDQIMDAVPMDGREEFMERVGEARVTINEYLANPGNADKQKEAAEILTNPEFVSVRAAFEEGLADNAAEIIRKLNA